MSIREHEPKDGVRQITAAPALTEEEAAALAGTYLDEGSYDVLFEEDVDVYRPDGTPLIHFRKMYLDADVCRRAYPALREAATGTDNRGMAAGVDPPDEFERISTVLYYREKMTECGTSEEERLRAANDRGGFDLDD